MLSERPTVPARVTINGHPIHPLLVPLPIGLLVFAPVSDIVHLSSDSLFWADASWWLLVGGLATGALAALVGVVDFAGTRRARNRTGWTHFIGNVVAMALTFVNVLLRAPDRVEAIAPGGLILSLAVLVILGFTGWQGGELVFKHGIGVQPVHQDTSTTMTSPPPEAPRPPTQRAREARG